MNTNKQETDLGKLNVEDMKYLLNVMKNVETGLADYPKTKEQAQKREFKFWNQQPVPKLDEKRPLVNIIDADIKTRFSGSQKQMFRPYVWTVFDLSNDKEIDEVCDFLNKNYLSDTKDHFRLHYTKEYIRWSLGPNSRMIGIRAHDVNGPIGGTIASSTRKYQIFNKEMMVNDINYLCVHPKLRHRQLAEMLIEEITRLSLQDGTIVGSFTTQRYVPTPVCRIEFYHRPLNYNKLHKTNFIKLSNNETLEQSTSRFEIRYQHKHKVVKMDICHMKDVYDLLSTYQDKYNYYQIYSFEEFQHFFSNSDIVSSFVILDDNGDILDFYSYYRLPYYVKESDSNKKIPKFINAVYMHMYTSLNVTQLTIFKSAMLCAYEQGNDVFNSTDVMENGDILFDNFSKFCKGSGYLYYNFYNLACPDLSPKQICRVAL
jgi:glycylpeptide N-tetradecanoyltransferase